jgi:hypothetical protein
MNKKELGSDSRFALPFESINKLEHFNPNREKESEEKEKPFRSNIEKRKSEKNNNK